MIGSDPAAAKLRLESASLETERLQHLVDGLLALARAEGRGGPTDVIDVAETARERAEVWSPLAEEQGIVLAVHAPDRAEAMAVAGAVEQIIDNFVDNALAVTPAGGRIDVDVEFDHGSGPASARRVALHVRDNGPGMTDEQIARAFDRFWRASGSSASGSGLGLAIVAQLAAASDATSTITRRPSGGIDAAAFFQGATTDAARISTNRRTTEGSAS